MRSVEIYYYASQSSHFENILQFCVQKIRNFGRDRRRRAALLPVRLPEDAVRTVSVISIRVSAGIAFTVGAGHVIIHSDNIQLAFRFKTKSCIVCDGGDKSL